MSKIEEAIEEIVQVHINTMDFSDMITSEVRDTWDMDELDRVDETVDRVDALELWIHDAEDKLGIQNVIDLENSVKNLIEHTNQLQLRIAGLEKQANKSFIQKLMFWR